MRYVNVDVISKNGDRYSMPGVAEEDLKLALAGASSSSTQIVLGNLSGAVMVLPWRIVLQVLINGRTAWETPSPSHPQGTSAA